MMNLIQNNKSLVSIIVATHNRASTLKDTVKSILLQTYENFELIIIDDNSVDHTYDIVSSFSDHRIKYFLLKESSGGPALPRNLGIKNSIGSYIAFCDDDDIWKRNKLEIQIKYLQKNNLDLVSTNIDCFTNDVTNIIFSSKNRKIFNIYDLILTNQINTSTVLLKKNKDLEFNESKHFLSNGEDYLLWLKLYKKKYKFGFLNESLVFYRVWNGNISSRNTKQINLTKIKIKFIFFKENPEFLIFLFCYISIMINILKFMYKKIFF
jgi:teichuronic acid biosynthesis glycosyltransferase TuaG